MRGVQSGALCGVGRGPRPPPTLVVLSWFVCTRQLEAVRKLSIVRRASEKVEFSFGTCTCRMGGRRRSPRACRQRICSVVVQCRSCPRSACSPVSGHRGHTQCCRRGGLRPWPRGRRFLDAGPVQRLGVESRRVHVDVVCPILCVCVMRKERVHPCVVIASPPSALQLVPTRYRCSPLLF